MLFSLTNLPKKSLRDSDGELAVVPRFLKGRAALRLIEQAIELFEGKVGERRDSHDPRAMEGVMGDYRMGRCVEACLLTHYNFVQPTFESVLDGGEVALLAVRGVDGPSALRLALWDTANARYGGFAPPGVRDRVMSEFAEENGLAVGAVDKLLALDSEGSARFARVGERPSASEIVVQYNRGAVKTLLAHSTRITFSLRSVPGAALKRTYFVAKRRGVVVDVEREGAGYALTLYGPEQATGGTNYGLRLADVALSLLRSLLGDEVDSGDISATAYLVMHEREYRFHVTPETLGRMGYGGGEAQGEGRVAERGAAYSVGGAVEVEESGGEEPSFDSMVEARLYREFKSLERQGYTHGWRLVREPDPLVASGVVMIPDFAFSRGEARVFMEIAGFWAPGYTEKKLAKLRALAGGEESAALILAVPLESAGLYRGLPYPVVPYKNEVRATELLTLLNAKYGERERREDAAALKIEGLRRLAREKRYVSEGEIAAVLEAYSRTELIEGARSVEGGEVVYVAGVGLVLKEMLGRIEAGIREALRERGGRVTLEDGVRIAEEEIGAVGVDIESLVGAIEGVGVERPSLFEAYLIDV